MARKRTESEQAPALPTLTVSRAEAAQKIQRQVEKGCQLRDLSINSKTQLDAANAESSKWSGYNTELLKRLFDNSSIADEYNYIGVSVIPGHTDLHWWINDYREELTKSITRLESILGRLDLIPEPNHSFSPGPSILRADGSQARGNDVFIVHGHDEATKEATARFVEKLGLRPVILHEQPNAGRTIIEKFETFSNVGFAIVLLTPDDSCLTGSDSAQRRARARQNVIFELGYFVGRLGRQRVCALYKEGVEIPSDYQGVLYIPLDAHRGWQFLLAREIKGAGIEIDMNKAL